MKKLLTVEDFVITLVAALGYGFTFEIPKILGYPMWLCSVICLVVGVPLETLEKKLIFSGFVQRKKVRRYAAVFAVLLVFLAAQYIAVSWIGMDTFDYITGQFGYIIGVTLLAFACRSALRRYRIRKIRERYNDGADGFVFDDLLKRSDIDEFNKQNQRIHGKFDADFAVKTKNGVFVGEKYKDSLFFCGIPYAKPPVGELRWKAPEPPSVSADVVEAKYFGASAIQVDYDGSVLKHHRQSEDCLTLNICVPRKKMKGKNPVIVVFHHGDFSYGGSADPLLHAGQFNKIYPDALYVTFNYRLGILGFIDFSEVPGGDAYPDALNLGLLDQIAALRWIKENIAAFGGDPEQITVMGFEAGSLSISLLAACKEAKGLFQKAFIFHGSPLDSYETPEKSGYLAKELLTETAATTMNDLMRLSTERLKEVSQKIVLNLSAPTRDGKLIPRDVYAAYRDGSAADIEFIIGIPRNETQVYKSFVGDQEYANYIEYTLDAILPFLDTVCPDGAKAVRAYVEAQSSALEVKAKVVEEFYALMTYQCAQKLAASGSKVRLLYWDAKSLIENLGSGTVDVVAMLLGNREAAAMYGNVLNADIAETLQNLFRKFVGREEIKLFNNEIKGIGAIDWQEFPKALIVSEKDVRCGTIADKLTEIKELLGLLEK